MYDHRLPIIMLASEDYALLETDDWIQIDEDGRLTIIRE